MHLRLWTSSVGDYLSVTVLSTSDAAPDKIKYKGKLYDFRRYSGNVEDFGFVHLIDAVYMRS